MVTKAAKDSFGHEAVDRGRKLYLAAGGSDFLAKLDKGGGGKRSWVRDTMGSVQAVTVMGNQLVIGGHFLEVADQPKDDCGCCLGVQDPSIPPTSWAVASSPSVRQLAMSAAATTSSAGVSAPDRSPGDVENCEGGDYARC